MLELRPNCEYCDRELAPDSAEACICTYECTFCSDCVETLLDNVCPNCGGGFSKRPIRPRNAHRTGVGLAHQPASSERVHAKYSRDEIQAFSHKLASTPPEQR
jgi:hypothetical protein